MQEFNDNFSLSDTFPYVTQWFFVFIIMARRFLTIVIKFYVFFLLNELFSKVKMKKGNMLGVKKCVTYGKLFSVRNPLLK